MKIATFNANSIRARIGPINDWLTKNKPDVLCVQETKVQDKDFPSDAFADSGYRVVFKGMKSYNGVAVFSVDKPEFVSFGLNDQSPHGIEEQDQARLAHVCINGVSIINTYVPQGYLIDSPKFAYKLEWYKRLRQYFDKHLDPQKPALWCGDMNVAPESLDVHHPEDHEDHVCFHKDAKAAYQQAVAWGWQDVFRKLHPGVLQYTFFDYRYRAGSKSSVEANLGWRIDHLMASAPLAAVCEKVEVDMAPRRLEKASDHTFVWAEFRI